MKKWAHNIQTPEDSVKIKFMEIRDEKHVGGYGYGLRIYEGGLEISWSSHQILSSINNWWRELLFSTREGSWRRRSKCKMEWWGLNKVKLTSKFQMRFRFLIHLAFAYPAAVPSGKYNPAVIIKIAICPIIGRVFRMSSSQLDFMLKDKICFFSREARRCWLVAGRTTNGSSGSKLFSELHAVDQPVPRFNQDYQLDS